MKGRSLTVRADRKMKDAHGDGCDLRCLAVQRERVEKPLGKLLIYRRVHEIESRSIRRPDRLVIIQFSIRKLSGLHAFIRAVRYV